MTNIPTVHHALIILEGVGEVQRSEIEKLKAELKEKQQEHRKTQKSISALQEDTLPTFPDEKARAFVLKRLEDGASHKKSALQEELLEHAKGSGHATVGLGLVLGRVLKSQGIVETEHGLTLRKSKSA